MGLFAIKKYFRVFIGLVSFGAFILLVWVEVRGLGTAFDILYSVDFVIIGLVVQVDSEVSVVLWYIAFCGLYFFLLG